MEKINILYIDDNPDLALSGYLGRYKQDGIEISSKDLVFEANQGYESLIKNSVVKSANIIFIDSKLFENRTATVGKFTGEEFKIILRKYFPFIEVVVITQNNIDEDFSTFAKYKYNVKLTPEEYYRRKLPEIIDKSIKNVCEYRKIAKEMKNNDKCNTWGFLLEKINNSLEGVGTYDELNKTDIDDIISAFKGIQVKLDE